MGNVTGIFVNGEPFDTGIDAEEDEDDEDDGISELEETFPDPVSLTRDVPKMLDEGVSQKDIAVAAGLTPGRVSQIKTADVVKRKYTKATSFKKGEAPKKAQGSATRERKLAERKEAVAVALREGDGLKEVRARCHVGKVTVYEVLKKLLEEGEVLKCRCGREAMHRGGCKKPANQVSSSYSQPADVVPMVKTVKISQEKPTVDKIIPSGEKLNSKTIMAIIVEIRLRYDAKITELKVKRDMVLAAMDELIDN
uniref:Putative DNA binding, helix-turn-helix domain containing protein n=1 Tax=viral metagenome TaxID=1070528 RepID=A0A6M3LNF6_9ZZZZ